MQSLANGRPRAVFVGKSRMPVPPRPDDEMKYEINTRHLRAIVVCTSTRPGLYRPGGATVVGLGALTTPVFGTVLFYLVAPVVGLALAMGRRQTAIVCQSPYEGFGVVAFRELLPRRLRPRVQIELHGDWRTATRTYGSPRRRLVSGPADRIAEWSLRRADRVRPVSDALARTARDAGYRGPIDRYIEFSDYGVFLDEPTVAAPDTPHVVFVGVLERHKAPDVLLDAWSAVVQAVPGARLTIVGVGHLEDGIRAKVREQRLEGSVELLAPMARRELRSLFDRSSCLVLPSRSEGLGRVVLEAMARGRPVVASRVGGIVELVEDGCNGRLVEPGDARSLGEALIATIRDRRVARAMGDESRRRAIARDPLNDYESGIQRTADWIRA